MPRRTPDSFYTPSPEEGQIIRATEVAILELQHAMIRFLDGVVKKDPEISGPERCDIVCSTVTQTFIRGAVTGAFLLTGPTGDREALKGILTQQLEDAFLDASPNTPSPDAVQ